MSYYDKLVLIATGKYNFGLAVIALAIAGRPTLGWVLGVAFVINTILDYLAG